MILSKDATQSEIKQLQEAFPEFSPYGQVVSVLKEMNLAKVTEILTEYMFSCDDSESSWGLNYLLEINPTVGFQILFENRHLYNWEWLYCYKSGKLRVKQNVSNICSILSSSNDENSRYMAAVALGNIGDDLAVSNLVAAKSDTGTDYEGRKISVAAIEAIQQIQNRE